MTNPPSFRVDSEVLFKIIKESRDKEDGQRLIQGHLQRAYKSGYGDAQAVIRNTIGAASQEQS